MFISHRFGTRLFSKPFQTECLNLSSENDPKDEKIKHQETCNNLKKFIEKLIKEVRFAKPLNKVLSGY